MRDHKQACASLGAEARRAGCLLRLVTALIVAALLGAAGQSARAGSLTTPGCLDGGEAGRVAAVAADLTLTLADGRTVLLAGLDPVLAGGEDDVAKARAVLSDWLVGRTVMVRAMAAQADRWGRMPAFVFAGSPGSPPDQAQTNARVSVAEAMLDAGLARVRPDSRATACRQVFLALEGRARDAGAGIWTQSRDGVIPAEDDARLRAVLGRMAIVEGRVASIFEGRSRIYLRFGENGRDGFTITVEQRLAAKLKAVGTDVTTWRGRRVRVRGLIDDRFGLQIELTTPDQIEFTGTL